MMEKIKDVHTEHCCREHGCKYGDGGNCTVMSGQKTQSFACEVCDFVNEERQSWIERLRTEDYTVTAPNDIESGWGR